MMPNNTTPIITQITDGNDTAHPIGVLADNVLVNTGDSQTPNYKTLPQFLTKVFKNITVASNSNTPDTWVDDTSNSGNAQYSNFPTKATITNLTGVTSNSFAKVVFGPDQASSGNFAAVCSTGDGTITIYAKTAPSSNITIPTIIVWGSSL